MSKNIYIFDLDDTLYKIDNNKKTALTINISLLNLLDGPKIIFSNATHNHCIAWLDILNIRQQFQAIFSYTSMNGYKPNPFLYNKITETCNLQNYDNVYFFDDKPINLYPAKQLGWKTYLIGELLLSEFFEDINNKTKYIDAQFNNINNALEYILVNK